MGWHVPCVKHNMATAKEAGRLTDEDHQVIIRQVVGARAQLTHLSRQWQWMQGEAGESSWQGKAAVAAPVAWPRLACKLVQPWKSSQHFSCNPVSVFCLCAPCP